MSCGSAQVAGRSSSGASDPGEQGVTLEIRIHGRGGQGAQVGCQILAGAFFRAGRWAQAFAAYGGERRGAPVTAFLRVADRPLRVRADIEHPDHVIVLDPSLLAEPNVTAGIREGGSLLVDAPLTRVLPVEVTRVVAVDATASAAIREARVGAGEALRVLTVDATSIAMRWGLGPIVSTAMLGAFAGATGLVSLETLLEAVREGSPSRLEENILACREAYAVCARLDAERG
ncbi:MAG: 2-oxoacid:acceptor oxidoreductase family protein [Candidatus Rokubacteria bacterium]|nr:2-oxoacid:acceptor oxidoreductase family protein [Candidatus Rokubacteria bacterium]